MLNMQQSLVYYPHTVVLDITCKNIGGPGSLRARRNYSIFTIPHLELLLNEHLVPSRSFKIFKSQPFFPLKTQVKIVMACCALHNWILEDGPDEYVYDDTAWYTTLLQSVRNRHDIHQENMAWANKRDAMA
jgi:hypothetical protein